MLEISFDLLPYQTWSSLQGYAPKVKQRLTKATLPNKNKQK